MYERGQGNIIFPVQLTTSRIGNLTRLIHTFAVCVTGKKPQKPNQNKTKTTASDVALRIVLVLSIIVYYLILILSKLFISILTVIY